MNLQDFINNQKISNIQWINQTPEILVWRFPDPDQVLQNNSTVIINPGQAMLFVNEGKPQGVISEPGSIDLKTANIPFLTSMLSVFRGFESKHKGKVFFFNMTIIPNVKWGTPSPIKYIDSIYKIPVGLRAFGNYSFKISDPMLFYENYVGDRDEMTVDEFRNTINGRIITLITDALAEAKFPFTEIDSKREELTKIISEKISNEFPRFGFTMEDFRIENTDFTDETQEFIKTIAAAQVKAQVINALGEVNQNAMNNYAELQKLEALNKAAENPNNLAGTGLGAGIGIGFGASMANEINKAQNSLQNQQSTITPSLNQQPSVNPPQEPTPQN